MFLGNSQGSYIKFCWNHNNNGTPSLLHKITQECNLVQQSYDNVQVHHVKSLSSILSRQGNCCTIYSYGTAGTLNTKHADLAQLELYRINLLRAKRISSGFPLKNFYGVIS